MPAPKTIAIMIDLDWPIKRHQEVMGGIQDYARQNTDWQLIHDLHPEAVLDRYDGIVGRVTEAVADRARNKGIPMVNTWRNSPTRNIPSVFPDSHEGTRKAAQHLAGRGFRNFGFIGMRDQDTASEELKVFREEVHALGHTAFTSLMVSSKYNANEKRWRLFQQRVESWVDSWQTPMAVYTQYDILARHIAPVCTHKGLTIPQDVSMVGAGNEPGYCLLSDPQLSSIEFDFKQLGYRAAALLDDLLEGRQAPADPVILKTVQLIPRQSSDAYAVDDPVIAKALRFIADHSHECIRVSDVARGVGISRRGLERRFELQGGRTIRQEIIHFKVERLKRLLVQSDQTMKQLAFDVGFKDGNQMYLVFNRVVGMSPSRYRKQQQAL